MNLVFKDEQGNLLSSGMPVTTMEIAKNAICKQLTEKPTFHTGEVWDGEKRIAVYRLQDGQLINASS